MKKTTEQATEDTQTEFDLKPRSLSAKQSQMRDDAVTMAAEKFTKNLAKNALGTRTDFVQSVFTQLSDPAKFDWSQHGELCVALGDIRTRDGLLRMLHDEAELRTQVCDHLAREIVRTEKQWIAPLATVFGGIVWLAGFPDKTRGAIDLALASDPSYSLALLLDIALRHNVPASVWSASLEAVSFEACLKGAA